MDTKGKRATRPVGPPAIPSPATIPGATASAIVGPGEAETTGDSVVELASDAIGPGSSAPPGAPTSGLPMALPAPGPHPVPGEIGREPLAMLAECRAALTHGLDALSEEAAALTRSGIEAAARAAIELLAVRTWSDALAVNAGFARASLDNWIVGSARFSELGAKLAVESWHPLITRLGKSWNLGPG
jgi:phasin protein